MMGESPNEQELDRFSRALTQQRSLPDGFVNGIILAFPDNDIMNKLMTTVTVLGREDPDVMDTSEGNVIKQCTSLIAKFPTIIAYAYQAKKSQEGGSLFIHPPNGSKSTAENFLYMLRENKQYTPLEAQILDMMLVLHAEHSGGNNSTFTNHVVSSTLTDTYSAMVAALASLRGPLHGGANLKVMGMMDGIKANVSNWEDDGQVADYLTKILSKEVGDHLGKIWGMGHAVYTLSDPRAVLLRGKSEELAAAKGRIDEFKLYETVARLTKEVMSQQKGRQITIAPNVDYFSGFVYDCMGFPRDVYPALFAMARIAGWSAHRIEELVSGKKIIRPASVYVGPKNVGYVPLARRT
jgi:citrate synthase